MSREAYLKWRKGGAEKLPAAAVCVLYADDFAKLTASQRFLFVGQVGIDVFQFNPEALFTLSRGPRFARLDKARARVVSATARTVEIYADSRVAVNQLPDTRGALRGLDRTSPTGLPGLSNRRPIQAPILRTPQHDHLTENCFGDRRHPWHRL